MGALRKPLSLKALRNKVLSTVFGLVWSPSLLFANNEVGAWYDPSDLSTMFQDAAGTTPVTAVEQPVGLLLDKSKGLALGAELVTNGDFSNGSTGWSLTNVTVSGGVASFGSGVAGWLTQNSILEIGKTYQITFTLVTSSAGNDVKFHSSQWSPEVSFSAAPISSGPGTYTVRLKAVTTNFRIDNYSGSGFQIDNISVRELPGNHASQSTAASRPVLSARVNQLLATATLSTQSVTTLATTYTLAFSGAGTVTASGTNVGVYSAGSNSLVCTAGTLTLTVSGSVTLADLRVTNAGVNLPAYQRVAAATDYDTSGFPLYLKFDGVDDGLATGSIDFTATDKMSVFAGVRKLSDSGPQVAVELSAMASSNSGSFVVYSSLGASEYAFGLNGNSWGYGSATSFSAPITNVVSALYNIGGASDATEVMARINGSPQTLSFAADPGGTGNFGNYPLYIGRRGGSALPYSGHIYSLIVRGAASTDTQIASTETYVNNLTKA